jgi:hypothetical protein
MKNIYMAGGAWGMIYQLGAITKLRDTIKQNNTTLYGCSAGALSWVLMLLYTDESAIEFYRTFEKNVHDGIMSDPFSYTNYNLTVQHFKIFDIINKDHPSAYLVINGRLNAGITTERGFEWCSTFTSNADMFNKLLCSFHVPFLCSYNAMLGKTICMDGGFGIVHAKELPDDCFVITPREYRPSPPTNHKYINGNIPILFCITPPPDILAMYYYNKGAEDMIKYLNTGETATSLISYVETNIPIQVWWILRYLQPVDTENSVSIFE